MAVCVLHCGAVGLPGSKATRAFLESQTLCRKHLSSSFQVSEHSSGSQGRHTVEGSGAFREKTGTSLLPMCGSTVQDTCDACRWHMGGGSPGDSPAVGQVACTAPAGWTVGSVARYARPSTFISALFGVP